ncbi:hypothetical protein TrLO_g13096 [Triparma laevis f. longispina]|uniref:Uncharacterized protein n=1 Tax=Triparma laevis f. longispina TaxID=1714387 RepID=A0A9W7FST3_9STRA|nr:hypothetical protein TrLO_g13096 [Triparma laevis f. longispina]
MMAPPPRNASGRMAPASSVRSRYADPMAAMGFVNDREGGGGGAGGPPAGFTSPPASGPPPSFTDFSKAAK